MKLEKKEFQWLPHLENSIPLSAKGYTMSFYSIALEGWRRGLKLKFINENRRRSELLFELESDKNKYKFVVSRGELITSEAQLICRNKIETKEYLLKNNVSTPKGQKFEKDTDDKDIISFANKTGYPLVIKPSDGTGGRGVIAGIEDEAAFIEALKYIREDLRYKEVIVENYFQGDDFRVYVIDKEVVGIIKRIPANVVGDGQSTIAELIEEKNKLRQKSPILSSSLIKIDKELRNMLQQIGYDTDSVPSKAERVFLKSKNNISAGGDPVDITNEVSEEIQQVAIDGVNSIPGLPHAGVDLMVNEDTGKATIIEINTQANIRTHLFPMIGEARDIPSKLIDYYFPETKSIRRDPLLYFEVGQVKDMFTNGSLKEYVYPKLPKGKIVATRFLISGKVQGVNYGAWVRRKARDLDLNGYVKFLESSQVSIIVAGEESRIEEFRRLIHSSSSRDAKIVDIEEKNRGNPVKIGFTIVNASFDQKIEDGYFPVRLEGISRLGKKKVNKKRKKRNKKVKNYEKKYNELISSRSWKITKPLTLVARIVKKQ